MSATGASRRPTLIGVHLARPAFALGPSRRLGGARRARGGLEDRRRRDGDALRGDEAPPHSRGVRHARCGLTSSSHRRRGVGAAPRCCDDGATQRCQHPSAWFSPTEFTMAAFARGDEGPASARLRSGSFRSRRWDAQRATRRLLEPSWSIEVLRPRRSRHPTRKSRYPTRKRRSQRRLQHRALPREARRSFACVVRATAQCGTFLRPDRWAATV